ncbi:MAG: hypothetical protein HY313_11065 [Acidobacteria bacterium]|nr:hypothetical protein [Acidobacteriota bacterium]
MALQQIRDWNGRDIPAVRTRAGVWAFLDFADNLMRGGVPQWPAPELVQKLCLSDKVRYFSAEDQHLLVERLGYYSDLQSAHSEDAIQWSYFGTVSYAPVHEQVKFANSLLQNIGIDAENSTCSLAIWRRVPHPDSLNQNGPELDFLIVGDRCVIVGESKWRSAEGFWQGASGTATQLELRRGFLRRIGKTAFGATLAIVLYVLLDDSQVPAGLSKASDVPAVSISWSTLARNVAHPFQAEFQRYYEWKRNLIARPYGVTAPG